jgi:hypothetical protein
VLKCFLKENASMESNKKKQARIQYMVSFTNLTFGEDVSRHISSYIETIYKRDWATRAFYVANNGDYSAIIFAIMMFLGVAVSFWWRSTKELGEKFKNIQQYYNLRLYQKN